MKTVYLFALFTALSLNCDETLAQPSIDYPPRNQTVILYQQATFGVIASSTAPFFYQWHKDDVPIAGATNDQIVLAHPQFSDAGDYSVVVSNADGSATSADATLTVNPPKAGDVDCSFVCGGSINGEVRSVAVQPDGRVLIFGSFSTVNGAARPGIARLNAEGTTDYTFMHGLSGVASGVGSIEGYPHIYSVAVQSDGKVLIAGDFTVVNGVSRKFIARLNPDGTLDSGFQADVDAVTSLALQPDGMVLIGGGFATVNGVSRSRIARLSPDGTLDSGFLKGLSGVSGGGVDSVAVLSDGKVLVAGGFTTVNGVSRSNIARLNADGSLDASFQVVVNGDASSVALQSDGKVLIFTTVNGASYRTHIARLNADGSLDTSFQNGLFVTDGIVLSIAVQSDGKVLIGGRFWTVNGVSRNGIARLNMDGTLDGGFRTVVAPIGGNFGGDVRSVATQSDGKVLIGGRFWTVNGASRNWIARLNADGTLDSSFPNEGGPNAGVHSVAVQRDGKMLIGGGFTRVSGVSRNWIARLEADGTLDSAFQIGLSGLEGDYSGRVNSVAVQSDGKVLIGGFLMRTNDIGSGPDYYSIVRLNADGTLDSGFQAGLSVCCYPETVALQTDGKVLFGGDGGIARLNADGTLDMGFQNGLSAVHSITVHGDGKVLVGGQFTVNGVGRSGIVRLNTDGTMDSGFQNGLTGSNNYVNSVAVQSNGKVLIGGWLTTVDGPVVIARLNADGTLDMGFQNGLSGTDGGVLSVAVQSDGKVLIGGGGTNVARLNTDGTLDSTFTSGTGATAFPYARVYSVAVQSDGKVLIGGDFTTVNGVPAPYIARLWGSADIPPQLKSITRSGAEVNLSWYAISNRTYRVQYKTDFSANTWTDLAGDISASGATASKSDMTATDAGQRFYRVVLLP